MVRVTYNKNEKLPRKEFIDFVSLSLYSKIHSSSFYHLDLSFVRGGRGFIVGILVSLYRKVRSPSYCCSSRVDQQYSSLENQFEFPVSGNQKNTLFST